MREIKVRGKSVMTLEELEEMHFTDHENGWFTGSLVMFGETPYIVGDFIEVDQEYTINDFWVMVHPESVGQYTGLEDKNGREIYEGDVVVTDSYKTAMLKHWGANVENEEEKYVIKFERGSFRLCDLQTGDWVSVIDHHVMSKVDKLSVIGNIYENPELLEVKK